MLNMSPGEKVIDLDLQIGKVIRDLRDMRGWTQAETADRLRDAMMYRFGCSWGSTVTSIANLEAGRFSKYGPHAKTIVGLADIFEVTTDCVLGLEEYNGGEPAGTWS